MSIVFFESSLSYVMAMAAGGSNARSSADPVAETDTENTASAAEKRPITPTAEPGPSAVRQKVGEKPEARPQVPVALVATAPAPAPESAENQGRRRVLKLMESEEKPEEAEENSFEVLVKKI